ncbi:acetyltransferase GCN5 [Amylibacter marinus]|uniref:Acetyltransferase GCN5 n=1 Tax=Amylibacter marinus TaxID=1475483 RepID=A0ABQ5VWQ4_9RHOB|nr:GNAT family N-acetyltransferase [Amylibacter marinus]GLQ35739.1 acetyltransferase GCN5 [Amylibacter marinus]
MTISVETTNPKQPEARALLQQSHALMQSLYPEESCHYFSVDALCGDEVTFVTAKIEGKIMGCGAIARRDDYIEIKSMFVDPTARGQKLAQHILDHLITLSRTEGFSSVKLETGDGLDAAHALYYKYGFADCGPFGDYKLDPHSIFMEKTL